MKITIESTTQIHTFNGIECRAWEGETANGVKVIAFIPRIAVREGENVAEFERDLLERRPPSQELQAWPLRHIL